MKLTIGIPMYNAEKYISRCLNSLLKIKGVDNYEIICVDDGSTDSSFLIAQRYSIKYPQIRVIRTENRGAYLARSTIIDEARGEWVGFVDADDTVEDNMFFEMLCKAEGQKHVDIVVCAFNKLDSDNSKIKSVQMNNYGNQFFDFIKYPNKRGLLAGVNPAYWNKIFKREKIVNRLKLDTSPEIMEDFLFFASIIPFIDGIAFVDKPLYNYYDQSLSVTKSIGKKEYEDAKKGLNQLNNYLLQKREFQTDIYKKDLISVMSCVHLGIAFTINMNVVTEDVLKGVYYDSLIFLNMIFPDWWHGEYLKLSYLQGKPQLRKMYVACMCYRSKMWLMLVNVYHTICKIINDDMKW